MTFLSTSGTAPLRATPATPTAPARRGLSSASPLASRVFIIAAFAALSLGGPAEGFAPAAPSLHRAPAHRAAAAATPIVMAESGVARRAFLQKAGFGLGAAFFLRGSSPAEAVYLPSTAEVPAFTEDAISPLGMTQRDFMRKNGFRKSLNHDVQLVEDLALNIEDQIIYAGKLAGELGQASKGPSSETVAKLHESASKSFLIGRFQWPSRSTADDGLGMPLPKMTAPLSEMYGVLQSTRIPVMRVFDKFNNVLEDDDAPSPDITALVDKAVALRGALLADLASAKQASANGSKRQATSALMSARKSVRDTVPVLQELHARTMKDYQPVFAMKTKVHEQIEANIDYFRQFAANQRRPEDDAYDQEEDEFRQMMAQKQRTSREAIRRLALSMIIMD